MTAQHLIVYRPARPTFPGDATPEEQAIVGAHFEHLSRLCDEGRCVLAGRTQADATFGIAVLDGMPEPEARALLAADPAVVAGVFVGELHPFAIALERSSRP